MFCIIVWYVSASRIVLNVYGRFFTYVSVLRTVLKVFCLIVWKVSALRTVLNALCTIFCYAGVLRTVLNVLHCFLCVLFDCLVR